VYQNSGDVCICMVVDVCIDPAHDQAAVDAGGLAVVFGAVRGRRSQGASEGEGSLSGVPPSWRRCMQVHMRRAPPLALVSRTRAGSSSR
jgi:hypothetical protein